MNGDQSLNPHSPQVEMAFSLEEAPCGPTTSVGGSTGSLRWADCEGGRETDEFERFAEELETSPLAEDLTRWEGKEARKNQSFGERNEHEEGRL